MSLGPAARWKAGFSIMEVLVASLLLMGLIMATTQTMIVGFNANRSMVLDTEFNGLAQTMGLILGRPEVCNTSNLAQISFDGKVPLDLSSVGVPGTVVFKKGPLTSGLEVESIQLDQIIASTVISSTQTEWLVNLKIKARKTDARLPGRKLLVRDFRLSMLVDTSLNKVLKCGGSSLGASLADNCIANGGTFDNTTMRCDLAGPVCLRSGGLYDPNTKICDRSALHYTLSQSGSKGAKAEINVLCNSGDAATGGGAEPFIPVDLITGKPILSGNQAIGWSCSGNGIKTCTVMCERLTVVASGP